MVGEVVNYCSGLRVVGCYVDVMLQCREKSDGLVIKWS